MNDIACLVRDKEAFMGTNVLMMPNLLLNVSANSFMKMLKRISETESLKHPTQKGPRIFFPYPKPSICMTNATFIL